MRTVRYIARHYKGDGSREVEILITIPANAPMWAQQINSLQWFNDRELKRVYKNEDSHRLAWGCLMKYTGVQSFDETTRLRFDKPVLETDNIWEFYKLIGYDYKRKRYER